MKLQFKAILIIICLPVFNTAVAQDMTTQYFSDGQLKLATKNTHNVDMQGSPYLFDSWAEGEVRLSDGKLYKNLLLKFDEVSQTLMFKYSPKDSTMTFQYRPTEFWCGFMPGTIQYATHFVTGFDAMDGADKYTFYRLLSDGKVRLLKRDIKTITEHQEYGSNGTGKTVNTKTHYYLASGSHLERVKPTNTAIIKAMNDQADKIKVFLATNNLDMSIDDDLVKVINYYNTL